MSLEVVATSVKTAVGLIAFLAAAAVAYRQHQLKSRENLIKNANPHDLPELVAMALDQFRINTSDLDTDQKYNLTLRVIDDKIRRLKIVLSFFSFIAIVIAIILIIPSPGPTPLKPALEPIASSNSYQGDPSTLERDEIPDLTNAKTTYKANLPEEILPQGGMLISKTFPKVPGFFSVQLPANESGGYYNMLLNKEISGKFYLTATVEADESVATVELSGLGDENKVLHFLVDNKSKNYSIWEGDEHFQKWAPIPFEIDRNSNQYSLYQDGRYATFYINDKKVDSFTLNRSLRPGKVGLTFKRYRENNDLSTPKLADEDHTSKVQVSGFVVYDFLK